MGLRLRVWNFHFNRVQMAGVKAYGHKGKLYLAKLHVPEIEAGVQVKLTAKARWMICSNVCLPQYAELSITIPVMESPEQRRNGRSSFPNFWITAQKAIYTNWNASPGNWSIHKTQYR